MNWKRVLSLTVVAALVGASLLVPTAVAAKKCYHQDAKKLANKVNNFRASHGVPKASFDPDLSLVSRRNIREMKQKGKLRHMSRAEFEQQVTNWTTITDLVRAEETIDGIFKKWKNNKQTRKNMLNPDFHFVGVGIAKDNNFTWAHMILSGPGDPGTTVNGDGC